MKFKSKGMQWVSFCNHTENTKIDKQIGYWIPEERYIKEQWEILHDSEYLIVAITPRNLIVQFENN